MSPLLYFRHASAAARPAPLLLTAVFSAGLALAVLAGLFGLLLALLLVSWTFKYAFVCFDTIARGSREPPVLSLDMVNPADEQRPLGMLLIVGVFHGATAALAPHVPEQAIHALRIAALLFLPASVLALAITSRIVDAVNPLVLVDIVRRLGLDYAGLIAAVLAVGFAVYLLGQQPVWLAVKTAVALFGLLALFCAMGGLVYEKREALQVDVWHSPERLAARRDREAARELDREFDALYAHCRAGAYDVAWSQLLGQLAARDHEFAAYRDFHARLSRWPDARLADRLAKEFVSRHGARATASLAKPPPRGGAPT